MLNRITCNLVTVGVRNTSLLLRQTLGYSTTNSEKWEIYASVCLERLPVVTPSLDPMQVKYQKFLQDTELFESFKSDHEIRIEKDILFLKKLKSENSDIDPDTINKDTAQDFEDACMEEYKKFERASIETDADKKNDQTSLERKLQSHLVLLVEQKIGNEKKFLLPLGKHQNGESLRQTAERVFKEACGDDMNISIIGNAPCGYYGYKWHHNNESIGAKIFFYYANPVSGQISKDKKYKWLTRNELESSLPQKYHTSVSDFLVDE